MPRMTTCTICDKPMEASRSAKPGHKPAHNSCRTISGGLFAHGTSGYRYGCRCGECKAGQSTKMRAYADAVREEHGLNPTTIRRKQFAAANGYWPQVGGSAWIDPKVRHSLYERDDWTCQLCTTPIDRYAHWNADYAPSLDHIVPQSHTLIPDHDPKNLRTAHRICNSIRGDAIDVRLQSTS